MLSVALNVISALASFTAAVFWFRASGPLPQMRQYWDAAPATDPFVQALQYGAQMNRTAAMCAGIAALSFGLSLAIQIARSQWKP